jgi:hypothetical protein
MIIMMLAVTRTLIAGMAAIGIITLWRRLTSASRSRWLKRNCPNFWSLLNAQARRRLPGGLTAYLSGIPTEIEHGKRWLRIADAQIVDLVRTCGDRQVGDAYRRDLSGVRDEQQLAQILCEISVCAAISRIASSLALRPSSGKNNWRSDFCAEVMGTVVYGEVKRYADNWLAADHPKPRSIAATLDGTRPADRLRPQSMNIRAKLKDVPRQLRTGTMGILFIFHSGFGENMRYIQAALFGDQSFFESPENAGVTSPSALFALEDWRDVSACLFVSAVSGTLLCRCLWENPNAHRTLPEAIRDAFHALR